MSETFSGRVDIQDDDARTTIKLDGERGRISVGGGGQDGLLSLVSSNNRPLLHLSGEQGRITLKKSVGVQVGSGPQTAGGPAGGGVGTHQATTAETITLSGDTADISVGGNGADGDLRLKSGDDDLRIRLDAGGDAGGVGLKMGERIYLNGARAQIVAGGSGVAGIISVLASESNEGASIRLQGAVSAISLRRGGADRLRLDGVAGVIKAGGNSRDGGLKLYHSDSTQEDAATPVIHLDAGESRVVVRNSKGEDRIQLNGSGGDILLGGNHSNGTLILYPAGVTPAEQLVPTHPSGATIYLHGLDGSISLKKGGKNCIRLEGESGVISAGGNAAAGQLKLYHPTVTEISTATPVIHLDAAKSEVVVRSNDGRKRIHLDGGRANVWVGGHGVDGDLLIFPSGATDTEITEQASIHLNGQDGDIILKNADCAEEFDIASESALDAGTVMVLDGEGALRESAEAYDRKVAGVLSGAGDYRPGIVLDRKEPRENRRPLALVGKVFCKVDADHAPVEVGDLLTTSPTPGHAMKAADPARAFGAVIGKALRPLKEGRGLIPILVALQ